MPEDEHSFSADENGQAAPFRSLVANVGGRIQEMLDTAERVAAEIRTEAEAAGKAYLQERQVEADRIVQERMTELDAVTQSLAARAASMEHELTAFVAEVEQVRWRMARLIGDGAPQAHPASGKRFAPGAQDVQGDAGDPGVSQAAALRATQMAVAGAERADIEHMLRDQFGLDDPSAVDRVLRTGP
ncbi:MAG: hypothetical protein M3Y34_07085 [Actinomycetota bacterium]|nr:hypothetical protein [Actinomycetota bacterium]